MFTKSRCQSFFVVGLFVFLFCCHTVAADTNPQGQWKSKQERIKDARKKCDATLFFAGVVKDQHGVAVEKAVVTAHVRHYAPTPPFFMAMKEITVTTDKNGAFEIKDIVGSDLFIKGISKEGYDFNRGDNARTAFRYKGAEGEDVFRPDKKVPVSFILRQKGESVFLLEGQGGPTLKQPQSSIAFNFAEGRARPGTAAHDLVVSSVYQEERQEYALVFKTKGEGSGIIVTDQMLYEAPESGYESSYAITVKLDERMPRKNLYIKSRDASIYTRMNLGLLPGKKFIRLSYKSWTNPYGDRNLEPVPKMPFAIKKRLRDEAKLALKQNRHPKKRDLKALIKSETHSSGARLHI